MADISLGELIFGTTEEQQQRKANSILPGYTGVPPTQFEQFISKAVLKKPLKKPKGRR